MNSSLSRMLDQQLLMTNEPVKGDGTKNIGQNQVSDSMTKQIFTDGRIYLNDGAMAFQPLGMETVLETADEQNATKHGTDWKKKIKTGVSRYKSSNLNPRTTE